ncbi:MAG: oxidoreductase [Deltaproteobacteria bacterium HGW-Deltaproteobacteria-24]|jgi:NAD(P)-dependent dehydrogenase (short-subunit alcohol dehydrogenase family)|nr:MAG: oxidoreductase [Deltaproteobacteria bacterium HGW-Deltaproteobacteria-24]
MAKVVLITGATSGMGLETSILLALNGYKVYAGSRGNESELLEKAKEKGVQISIVPLDVTQTHSIQQAVKSVIEKEGKIDVLVNNAGFGLLATLEEGTDEEMFKQFDVNVFGLIKTTREVLPFMREAKSGVIINISSFLGKMGLPLLSHYNASKYAVEGITDSLRFEVAPFNIRVHSVLAGLFGTNFVKKGLLANAKTTSDTSPYKELVSHFVPIVGAAINEGPSPMPIAQAIKDVIENEKSEIAIKVGEEAETFVPLRKALSDKDFEEKIKETFGV